MTRRLAAIAVFICALALILVVVPRGSDAANANVGYVDFGFGTGPGGAPSGPDASVPSGSKIDATADKPQSKLWYTNDNIWWGVLYHQASGTYHIYRLNWPDKWVDTGVVVDDRPTSRADALWDGAKLYVASLVRYRSTNTARLYRFSYDSTAKTYSLDAGFPAAIMSGAAETMAFDKDSTGRLWITFTMIDPVSKKSMVWVNNSTTNDSMWGTPYTVPGSAAIGSDDISSLVAYKDKSGPSIGVLWSSHTSTSAASAMYFAYHRDADPPGSWQPVETIYGGTGSCLADDHINIKSLQADPSGELFAALKTSVGDSSSCTGGTDLIRLVVRKPDSTWAWAQFGTTSDNHTRPIVLLDTTNRKVYMFATSPTSCGVIYYKSTSMDNPKFTAGKGTAFISSSSYTCINNATSTKQTVNANTGLVVLASDESPTNTYRQAYLHNVMTLGSAPADTTPPTVTAVSPANGASNVGTSAVASATFSEAMNATTINGTNFTLTPAGGAPVAATVSYNSSTNVATLTPSAALAASTTYTAQISGVKDAAGNTIAAPYSWSFQTAAPPPPPTIPAAPASLSATAGDSQVGLAWAASGGATSYNVKRATASGGPYTTVASPTGTSYTDTGLTNGTAYYYVVTAVNSAGESAPSAEASATPAVPPTPTGSPIKAMTFESGCTSGSTCADGADSASGTVSWISTGALKGSGSAQVAPAAAMAYLQEDFTGVDNLYMSFYVRVNSLPGADLRIAQISNSGTTVGELLLRTNGALRLRNAGTTVGADSAPLVPGTLYRVGLVQKKGAGANAVLQAFVVAGDTAFGSPFAQTATGAWTTQANRLRFGATVSGTVNFVADDIKLDAAAMP